MDGSNDFQCVFLIGWGAELRFGGQLTRNVGFGFNLGGILQFLEQLD